LLKSGEILTSLFNFDRDEASTQFSKHCYLHSISAFDPFNFLNFYLSPLITLSNKEIDKINFQDPNGNTPLHFAVFNNNLSSVTRLIEYRANPKIKNHSDLTPLHLASMKIENNQDIVEKLTMFSTLISPDEIDKADGNGFSALHHAIRNNNQENVKILLSKGADINLAIGNSGKLPIVYAIENNNEDLLKIFISHYLNNPKKIIFPLQLDSVVQGS